MKRHQLNLRKRVENKCRIGERGQIPKNVTGLENEVGTPRQLRFLPNNFRGSYIYIYIYIVCSSDYRK